MHRGAPDGRATNALFGFFNMFIKLVETFQPDGVICAFDKGQWVRVSGKLINDDRREAKVAMLEKYPNLRRMYDPDDGNTQVLYCEDAEATFSSFAAPAETVRL